MLLSVYNILTIFCLFCIICTVSLIIITMEVKVLVQNVKSVSDQKWCITAKDETGGIMRFGLSKEYGEPHAGDEITLRYPRGIANKVVGMDLNGTRLY